ncbi:MAG: F0F1 ATP synthase subunit B [Phycisphaerales bacterium]
MNRFARFLVLALAAFLTLGLLAAPLGATAHAADDPAAYGDSEHQGPIATVKQGLAPAITALIAFAVVLAVIYVAIWPKMAKGLDERANKIKDEIAAAERARKQAADALDEYEKNLAEARAEAKAMLEQTKAEQTELAAQLRAKADKELTELRDRARQDIESAKRAAVNELYAESVTLASNIAGKILQREVSAGDQQRLVEESLAEMKASN